MRFLTEAFSTFRAAIGCHSCVNSFMFNKMRFLTETFPTFRAVIGFLPCMDSLLHNITYSGKYGIHVSDLSLSCLVLWYLYV
ncbi:hypothetical protein FKM82_023045 [Ascaphus truei]